MERMCKNLFLVVVILMLLAIVKGADENCSVSRCHDGGPEIHFPFWLKQSNTSAHPANDCAYLPGFQLSCGAGPDQTLLEYQRIVNTSSTGLQLSFKYKAVVSLIDYGRQSICIDTPSLVDVVSTSVLANSSSTPYSLPYITYTLCIRDQPLDCNYYDYELFNRDPFRICYVPYNDQQYYTFFNCSSSSAVIKYDEHTIIDSLSTRAFKIYAYSSGQATIDMLDNIRSCTKMYDISTQLDQSSHCCAIGLGDDGENRSSWSKTIGGGKCEAVRESCKIYDDGRNTDTDGTYTDGTNTDGTNTDFPYYQPSSSDLGIAKLLLAVLLPCIFLVVLGLIFRYNFIRFNKQRDKQREEDELKIKMFMENYKALKPTRYSYSDIKKMTNMFKHKLGQGGYGSVFKGQISSDILVAVKVLHVDSKANGDDFINEVGTIGKIHHVNVVRLLGYCADGCNRALVYEFQPNHSLEKFVYRREKQQNFIGWKKMQKIARGIAKGIIYLHHGCAQQILHFDIKPNNILLDQNFNPKISDFGLAKLCNKGQSIVSMTAARGTIGYIAPEVFSRNFGKVSSKSDVYSFGMLLLEMVGGKTNDIATEQNASDVYFPEWIFRRLEKGEELVIQVENEDDSKIARKLTVVGLWCIGWHPIDRPSMKLVIQMLEADECPRMPPNPFCSPTSDNATHAKSSFDERLQIISEVE